MKADFFYVFIIFYTSCPPFHPTKSVSCLPLSRVDQIFKADIDGDRTGRMKNTDPKTGSDFVVFFHTKHTIHPLQQNERL